MSLKDNLPYIIFHISFSFVERGQGPIPNLLICEGEHGLSSIVVIQSALQRR
jgi:hypothetical protein